MSSSFKTDIFASSQAYSPSEMHSSSTRTLRMLFGALRGMMGISLIASAIILGVSADSLAVYRQTHLPADYMLPLWSENMDIRPTNAFIACGVVVFCTKVLGLVVSRKQRTQGALHLSTLIAGPIISLVVAIVAVVLHYVVNASTVTYSIQSYTCQWKHVAMSIQPYFGTLCMQNEVGMALALLLIPLEAVTLAVAAATAIIGKRSSLGSMGGEKHGSPAFSG